VRLAYLASRLHRLGEIPARVAEGLVRGVGLADRVVWIGFVGLETVLARPRRG
jgi:hypothetical protein